jgi:hypothetical protein
MATMSAGALSRAQVEFFVNNNWLKLEAAIPPQLCERWVAAACAAHGVDTADPGTWGDPDTSWRPQRFLDLRHELSAPMAQAAPQLHSAICQLCGGEDRVVQWPDPLSSLKLDAAFNINYDQGADEPFVEPHPGLGGSWHVDGDFRHFLDSPEAGLFFIVLWGDVSYGAGPTYFAPDSIGPVLQTLQQNPGLSAKQLNSARYSHKGQCRAPAMPTVGKRGDAFLMHPSMLHCSSQNVKRQPRFMRNDQVQLTRPFRFDPADLSAVERCTLRNLGLPESGGLTDFQAPAEAQRRATDADTGEPLPWRYKERPSFRTPATERGLSATMYGGEAFRLAALAEGFQGARVGATVIPPPPPAKL